METGLYIIVEQTESGVVEDWLPSARRWSWRTGHGDVGVEEDRTTSQVMWCMAGGYM